MKKELKADADCADMTDKDKREKEKEKSKRKGDRESERGGASPAGKKNEKKKDKRSKSLTLLKTMRYCHPYGKYNRNPFRLRPRLKPTTHKLANSKIKICVDQHKSASSAFPL
jgi:hypothetical protein